MTNAWGGRTLTKKIPGSGFGVIRDSIQRAFLKNLLKRQGTAFLGRACRSASAPWWAVRAT